MAEAKFTPGPWSFAPAVPGAKRSFYISGNHAAHNREVDIATVEGGYYSCEANAALIAAAPDLYEALRALVDDLSANDEDGLTEFADSMAMARAALAKATA